MSYLAGWPSESGASVFLSVFWVDVVEPSVEHIFQLTTVFLGRRFIEWGWWTSFTGIFLFRGIRCHFFSTRPGEKKEWLIKYREASINVVEKQLLMAFKAAHAVTLLLFPKVDEISSISLQNVALGDTTLAAGGSELNRSLRHNFHIIFHTSPARQAVLSSVFHISFNYWLIWSKAQRLAPCPGCAPPCEMKSVEARTTQSARY